MTDGTDVVASGPDRDQIVGFLTDGYLTVQPSSLSSDDHSFLYRRAEDLYHLGEVIEAGVDDAATHLDVLGDNLRAAIPEIDRVLTDPAVSSTLLALLGPGYVIHPHSYCHRSGPNDQSFHQDGNLPWNERGHYRTHRPEWLLLFYYPQDVDETNGPTEVVAGSQYWTVDHELPDGGWHPGDRIDREVDAAVFSGLDLDARDRAQSQVLERGLGAPETDRRFLHVPAGTVVVAHYDLIHRGTRVAGHPDARYLFKFYAARVHDPAGWSSAGHEPAPTGLDPVVAANLGWLAQVEATSTADRPSDADVDALQLGWEGERVAAAYRLGRLAADGDERALAVLVDGLWSGAEGTRRASGHGLVQAGEAGVASLVEGLSADDPVVRRPSAAGLGTAWAGDHSETVTALTTALSSDPDALVRSNAAYALGHVGRRPTVEVGAIVDVLLDRLAPGAEPDNAHGAGLSRSTVRQSAAYALLQLLANHVIDRERMAGVIAGPMLDPDRYVQGLVVEGLARTPHLDADHRLALVSHLAGRRWSPKPSVA